MLAALIASACSRDTADIANPVTLDPCIVRANLNPAPVQDQNGPYYHQVFMGSTVDGVSVTNARRLLDHASVPDGVRLPDGRVLIYYVNGERGSVWIAQLAGDSARVLGSLVIDNTADPAGIVDPDALLAPNGKVRIYYLAGFGPPGSGTNRAICVAESADGSRFQTIGTALTMSASELLTDPSVVRLTDGSWRMAISLGQRTVMATSSDGISFTRTATLDYGGVPEIALRQDGALRLYVCKFGIESYVSTNAGQSWQREATVIAPPQSGPRIVCDPSYVAGASLFIYKTAP